MPLIIDDLRREHGTIAALLDILDRQAAIIAEAGEPDYDALEALAEYFTDYPQQVHHPKEDLVWQALKTRDPGVVATVGDLPGEHRRLAALTESFVDAISAIHHDAEVRREAVAHVIRRFVEAERQHMAKEDKLFLPAAARALKPEDWAAIATRAGQRPDPLADSSAEERFALLRRIIAEAGKPRG